MTTREKVDYRDRTELDENLDYRNENTEGNEEHQTEHPNSSYQAANQHMVKFNDELKVINEQTSLDFEFRKNPAEYDPAERSLTPVLVDGLDPVSVVSTVLYRIVGVGGRRRSRVRHQLIEVDLGIVVAVAPEDHVPGDAVVAGVVPGERHLVMGSRGVQAGALESRVRVKKELRRITKRNRGVSLRQVLTELGRYTDGWVGYFWVARTPSVFRELDQWLRRRLRCYQWKQWKQWKRPRTRAKGLLAAGVGRYLAWGTAYGDRGYWRVAGSPAMTQALPNAALQRLGFRSLLERYHSLVTH